MYHQSCKNDPPHDRLYRKIRPCFVENVDPRHLRFYIEALTAADEKLILEAYDNNGRCEAASVMLTLLCQRPGWVEDLIKALRIPTVNLGHVADEIERMRCEVLMVMDIDCQEEPMDVDGEEPKTSDETLNIFKDIVSTIFRELVDTPHQLQPVLQLLGQMSDVLFRSSSYGCLELSFQVKSIQSLYNLRSLHEGGALCDALSKGILNTATRQRIQKEAASRGVKVKNLSLKLTILEDDFSECEYFLDDSDLPSPSSYVTALTTPVDTFGEEKPVNAQMLLDILPSSYQKFLEEVISLTFDTSELQHKVMSLLKKPLCHTIKDSMDRLHQYFSITESVQNDLTKIGLNVLIRSFMKRQRNVDTVQLKRQDKWQVVWSDDEKEFAISQEIQADLLDPTLSNPVESLISQGWLTLTSEGGNVYSIPGSVRRAYLLCYHLPRMADQLPLTLFLDPNFTLESSVDFSLVTFAGIFLAHAACYCGLLSQLPHFPASLLYFPDVALFLSSVKASETSAEVKDSLKVVLQHFDFESFLACHKSPDVDRHWRTWKTVAANFGLEKIELVNKGSLDSKTFEESILVLKEALHVGQGNVISLSSKACDYNFQLAFRCVALLDLLQPMECREDLSVWKADSAVAHAAFYSGKPLKPRGQSQETSSPDSDPILESGGCLHLDAYLAKGFTSTRASDWSFKLDMSNTSLYKEQVSLLCKFLPQFDHITSYIFDNSGLDTCRVKQIISVLNPAIVSSLSLHGCSLNLDEGEIGLSRFHCMESLELENTGLTDSMIPVLVKEIRNMDKLKTINVGSNSISPSGFAILSSALITKTHLKALRIHNIHLGDVGGAILGQLVFALKHLEILSIWGCNIGDEGVRILSEQLPVHRCLKRLSMRNNNMTGRSSSELCKKLSACRNIQFFDCNSTSGDTENFYKNLLILFRSSSAWDHVSLWDCDLGKVSIFNDPSDFQNMANVTFLCLQKNGMSDDKIKQLSTCLLFFRFLQHLNLRENMVGDEGVEALVKALENKEHLEELLLDWNIFSLMGGKGLIQLALELDSLKSCDLSFSFQLAPPEKRSLAQMVGNPVPEEDGDVFVARRGQLVLKI
ncbi:uncharacterized protein [Haliotis asinina]|uniref:uncharacterized protein n=1 Tax=Haliotis asinina TaxID=109174 RepID=UPI003531C0D1